MEKCELTFPELTNVWYYMSITLYWVSEMFKRRNIYFKNEMNEIKI